MSDYDKEQWQAEQDARDRAETAYRDKMQKARQRSAANAKRKIARLHAKLTELGHISDFEDEFGESVLERLETYGSAFHDLEKGRAGDALSAAQKQVVARMNRKLKELKKKQNAGVTEPDSDGDYVRTANQWKTAQDKPASSFKSKRKNSFTPRVRHIEDDYSEATEPPPAAPKPAKLKVVGEAKGETSQKPAPYIPEYVPPPKPSSQAKRPFLRLVTK